MQEMRESVKIIYQCLNEMPDGLYKTPDAKVGGGLARNCEELELRTGPGLYPTLVLLSFYQTLSPSRYQQ